MEYIKSHKMTFIALIILIVILIILIQLKNVFMPSDNGASYGDRLADVKNITIKNSEKEEIKKKIEEEGIVKKASVRTQGKILRTIITMEDNISASDSKIVADKVSSLLNDKQKKKYDVEVLIKKDTDDKSFPIIGYKQHSKDGFSWTKDR